MKASKITLGIFSSGFLLFSLYKYFSQKRITKEQISIILKKITNLSVYYLFHIYDSHNKILEQKKESEEKSQVIIFSQENYILDNDFDEEILHNLNKIELEEIKKLNITKEEYEEYLIEYKNEDLEINKNVNLINNVLNSLKEGLLPKINFGFIIPEKYLQIMSNIYYFNIKKSYIIYYNQINLSKNNSIQLNIKERKEIFNNIYKSLLRETRNEICYFFGIDKDNNLEIDIKLALKIFIFYYDKNHDLRKKYCEINNNVNKIMNIIINTDYKIDVLTNDNNKYYIKDPVDKIIDLEHVINNTSLKNDFSINDEELTY